METVLTSGVFWTGLVGLGGILAAFFAPTRTQRTIERRREAREFRRARRVVADEMSGAADGFRFVAQIGRIPDGPLLESSAFMPSEAWLAERGVLATSLDNDVWQVVSRAMAGLEKGRTAIRERAGSDNANDPLESRWLANLQLAVDDLERAAKQLLEAKSVRD
jgi:hypothetical protein